MENVDVGKQFMKQMFANSCSKQTIPKISPARWKTATVEFMQCLLCFWLNECRIDEISNCYLGARVPMARYVCVRLFELSN